MLGFLRMRTECRFSAAKTPQLLGSGSGHCGCFSFLDRGHAWLGSLLVENDKCRDRSQK